MNYSIKRNYCIIYGTGNDGYLDGPYNKACFSHPKGITCDKEGNIYVADTGNNRVRKIDSKKNVSTLIGSERGQQPLDCPWSLFIDQRDDSDESLYVGDINSLRKIEPTGAITIVGKEKTGDVDGDFSTARFCGVSGIAMDKQDNLIVVDFNNHKVRKINMKSRSVSTIEVGTRFNYPWGIAVDDMDNIIITDCFNHRIITINSDGTILRTLGSSYGLTDGPIHQSKFYYPRQLAIDKQGNVLVADDYNKKIRCIGKDEVYTIDADINLLNPYGVVIKNNGNVVIADSGHHRIVEFIDSEFLIFSWPLSHSNLSHETQERIIQLLCIMTRRNIPKDMEKMVIQKLIWLEIYFQFKSMVTDHTLDRM